MLDELKDRFSDSYNRNKAKVEFDKLEINLNETQSAFYIRYSAIRVKIVIDNEADKIYAIKKRVQLKYITKLVGFTLKKVKELVDQLY